MNKPIIQIKVEGPHGSGKTFLIGALRQKMQELGYSCTSPASSYDPDGSVHAENEFHIVQIREKRIGMKATAPKATDNSQPITDNRHV